jgi:hypothetical protein
MSQHLHPVGEAGEQALSHLSTASPSTSRLTTVSGQYGSESADDNIFESFSSLIATNHNLFTTKSYIDIPPSLFEKTECSSKTRFSLKELEVGIAKGGALTGNKMSPATRHENEVVKLLLVHLQGKDRTVTAEEVIEHLGELGAGAVFDKQLADILKLLETRSEKTSNDDEGPSIITKAHTVIAPTGAGRAITDQGSNEGKMRKPLHVIKKQLSERIRNLGRDEEEWFAFEDKIGKNFSHLNCKQCTRPKQSPRNMHQTSIS